MEVPPPTTSPESADMCVLCPLKYTLYCSTTCSTNGIRGTLVASATRWTFATDATGRVVSATSGFSASTGIPIKFLYDHPEILRCIVHPDDWEQHSSQVFMAVIARKPMDLMFRQWHAPSRQYLLHHLEAKAHLDEDGSLVGYHGTVSIVEHLA